MRSIKQKKKEKTFEPFMYLLPAFIFFMVFTYYPFFKTIISSFFRVDSFGNLKEFVGLKNFISVLKNPAFHKVVGNTMVYTLLVAPTGIIIALILALIANKPTRTSRVYETMFALTMSMSMSVAAMIFKLAYNPTIGALNYILGTKINWLNNSTWSMVAVSAIATWLSIGYNFIFLLAAVRGIDKQILESAEIDGAGTFYKTFKIILPLISPTLFFLVVTSMAKDMMSSALSLIFTNSGQIATTANVDTMISYMYKQSINNLNYNEGYATAIIAFLMTFILMLISFKFEKKGVFYN